MKKNGLFKVLSLALVLLITTVFAACKEDDDFGIAGTYHFDNPQDNKIKHRIDFKPDSTYAVTKSNINKSFTGTWSVSENVVTMTPYAEGIIVSPENFDASRDNDKVTLKLKTPTNYKTATKHITTKYTTTHHKGTLIAKHPSLKKYDLCGNLSTQSQAPEDGYINVRNMLNA